MKKYCQGRAGGLHHHESFVSDKQGLEYLIRFNRGKIKGESSMTASLQLEGVKV